jgi:formiminoglutamate deiminase
MIDEAIGLVPDGPIHVHIAEQIKEVEQCINWSDKRPVKWLLDHTNVDDKWCFIHATHMTDAETEEFAETGAVAGLCPTTEANLGDGLFPLEQFLNLNGRIGIGSDSNTSVDAAEELRLLEYGQRLSQLRRNVSALTEGSSTGESLFRAALAGGAQALDQPTGVLTPGNRADIVVLDGRHPVLAGREESSILDSWIFTGGRELITDVFVAGNHMVKAGHHIHQDTIENRYRDTIEKLMRSE